MKADHLKAIKKAHDKLLITTAAAKTTLMEVVCAFQKVQGITKEADAACKELVKQAEVEFKAEIALVMTEATKVNTLKI